MYDNLVNYLVSQIIDEDVDINILKKDLVTILSRYEKRDINFMELHSIIKNMYLYLISTDAYVNRRLGDIVSIEMVKLGELVN